MFININSTIIKNVGKYAVRIYGIKTIQGGVFIVHGAWGNGYIWRTFYITQGVSRTNYDQEGILRTNYDKQGVSRTIYDKEGIWRIINEKEGMLMANYDKQVVL